MSELIKASNLPPFPWEKVHRPSLDDFSQYSEHLPHSAPGPDGIPYCAWAAAGELGARLVANLMHRIVCGGEPYKGFNYSLAAFIAKGSSDDDTEHRLQRAPEETRPLNLKNADCKLIARIANLAVANSLSIWANCSQRGFAPCQAR